MQIPTVACRCRRTPRCDVACPKNRKKHDALLRIEKRYQDKRNQRRIRVLLAASMAKRRKVKRSNSEIRSVVRGGEVSSLNSTRKIRKECAVHAVARDPRRRLRSSRLRNRRNLETNRHGTPSTKMLELYATEQNRTKFGLTRAATNWHGKRVLSRLSGIGRSPISRLMVAGEGAVTGIVLWLQGRDMRVQFC
jgi:hypothetical protein